MTASSSLPLIGLTGRKRSGKDTVARELAAHGYAPAAFADPLRDMVAAIDPIVDMVDLDNSCSDPDCCGGPFPTYVPVRYTEALGRAGYETAKEAYPEVRTVLQRAGTEGVRDVLGAKWGLRDILGDDLWIVLADRRIATAGDQPLVFTDVRFPNEADMIRRHGGLIVRVDRPDLGAPTDLHPSETAMDDYPVDHVILNDGTLAELAARAADLIN